MRRHRREPEPGRAATLAQGALTGLLSACLGAMLLLAAAQIFSRNAFRASIPHTEELLEWLVLWVAMLGAMAASLKSRHITIDALSHLLGDSARRWTAVAAQSFAMLVCAALMLITGYFWLESMGYGETTLGDAPRWLFESIVPAAFAAMAVAHGSHAVALICHGRLAADEESPRRGGDA